MDDGTCWLVVLAYIRPGRADQVKGMDEIEGMENEMDNEFDFRIGDVVCDISLGTGDVCEITPVSIWVKFENGVTDYYTLDGKSHRGRPHRSLYHGTWEQVFGSLPDLKPQRKVKRWVNLYLNNCHNGGFVSGETFFAAEDAMSAAIESAVAVAVEIEVDE